MKLKLLQLIQCMFIGFLIVYGTRAAEYTRMAYSVEYHWGVLKYEALTIISILFIAWSTNNLYRLWMDEQLQKYWDSDTNE